MKQPVMESSYRKAPKVVRLIREHVQAGRFRAGELLPPEMLLARKYGVSRMTLRKALAELVEAGVLVKLPQRGIIVPSAEETVGGGVGLSGGAGTCRQLSVAAFWAGVADYSTTQRLEGIRRYNETQGIRFQNYLSSSNEETLDSLERIEDFGVDGIFVFHYNEPRYNAVLTRLIGRRFPMVSFRCGSSLPISTVGSEDPVGVYTAVQYLILKYRRPVHFVGETAELDCSPDRYAAYRSAMEDNGFGDFIESHTWRMDTSSADPAYWPMDKKWQPGFHAAQRLLERVKAPVSIFAVNDYGALGVYKAAEERGLVVGKDVCVVGMDDLPLATMLAKPLTTLHASIEEIGFEGAKLLHRLITGKAKSPINVRLPLKLIERESA